MSSEVWRDPAWLHEAERWIAAELRHRGIAPTGPTEQPHVRPWSTVLRIPTDAGDLYFKASAPVQAFEVPLLRTLSADFADRLPDVLAYDEQRAWMLMHDGGTPLVELVTTPRDLHHWSAVVPLYAELQMRVATHVDELLRIGVPDLRLDVLPARFAELVDRADVTPDEREALHRLGPRIAELCDELGRDGLPATVQHNDLHAHNVLLRDGRYAIFDWGDSSISHPFQTMRTTLAFAAEDVGLPAGDVALEHVRDAYLEQWSDVLPREDLLRSFAPAMAIGGVSDVLTEDRHVTAAGLLPSPEDPRSVSRMLRDLLGELTPGIGR